MTFSLAGRRVLITGGSSGIGAALAQGFAERGAVVGICARRAERLEQVLAGLKTVSPESRSWVVDLADLDGIDAFARRAEEDLGGIDVLVNNAGVPKRRSVLELDAPTVDAVMRINYLSPVRLTLALLPGLIRLHGRIVNVASVAARLSPPGEAAYAASKAALTAWSECMQVDLALAGHDVLVHVVNPGVIDTELFHQPDNDPLVADVEALAVGAIVEPVIEQLDSGCFESYVPAWFGDVVAHKFPDTGAYLQGVIAYAGQRARN
ncbi:MAG TPA: SDR family NAD(P)-dependent oxidoreductase [Acidimicrobiales bacterium]|nr:SDR family NAD(P)-dependent oxidoreductase [Acidimicrobiales bacterium]